MIPDMTPYCNLNLAAWRCFLISINYKTNNQIPTFVFYCLRNFMDPEILLRAYRLMYSAKVMADTYEANRQICKYVHSTSRGHEAIQLATAFQLRTSDYVSPYYRDESLLLGLGYSPYELMLQLLTKADDPFSGGRSYYSHPQIKNREANDYSSKQCNRNAGDTNNRYSAGDSILERINPPYY